MADLEIRELPESVIALRREILHHPEIFEAAKAGRNFEDSLAIIATHLGIVLDGYYDVPELCDVLVTALYRKGTAHIDDRLIPVQRVETPTEVRLEDRGMLLPPGVTKEEIDTAVTGEVLKSIAPNDVDEKILAGGFAEEDSELTVKDPTEIFVNGSDKPTQQ